MTKKSRWILKTCAAVAIAATIYIWLAGVFQPTWLEWNNYYTLKGFYEEPQNTIETVFLGSSHVINGIAATELYRDYGICAYNFGTEQQPVAVSYRLLEETWRLHSQKLKTVALDVSMLRRAPDEAFYWKAISGLKFSNVKISAVKDYYLGPYGTGDVKDVAARLNPVATYHDRWKELTEKDFKEQDLKKYARGYSFTQYSADLRGQGYQEIVLDKSAEPSVLDQQALYYYQKICDFCKQHELNLILFITPTVLWTSSDHNAIQNLAGNDGLDFLDFNVGELQRQVSSSFAAKTLDGNHLNYYGATKLTNYMGEYLVQNYNATDVRGQAEYQFMEQELADYNTNIMKKVQYSAIAAPEEYLRTVVQDENNVVFITEKDDATISLTEEQRTAFENMGLTQLRNIAYREAYLAVIDEGTVVYEKLEENGDGTDEEKSQNAGVLKFEGALSDGTKYKISSSGFYADNTASCVINGEEQAQNGRGLNFVVYNKMTHEVVDSACFDTWAASTRSISDTGTELEDALAEGKTYDELTDNSKALYRYNYRVECIAKKKIVHQQCESDGLLEFLDAYNEAGKAIFISVRDEAANALTDEAREQLRNRGLETLSELQYRDSYIAVIKNGKVEYEQSNHGTEPIRLSDVGYRITSGGMESGNVSSILVNGKESSLQQRGLNIAVYDEFLGEVIDQVAFDTFEVPVRLEVGLK